MNFKDGIKTALKGFFIGSTMMVPGVSGGTMAMILGIYDTLIASVNNIFKKFKKSIIFLMVFAIPALIGIFLVASPLESLMKNEVFGVPAMFFFAGAIGGSVPLMFRKAQVKKFSWHILLFPLIGAGIVAAIHFVPANLFSTDSMGGLRYLVLVVVGFVIAIGLILPGVSASSMIYMFGMYEDILNAIKTFNLAYIIPLGIGGVLGVLLTTKLLDNAMKKYPKATYLMIFGFIIAAVVEVFPYDGITLSWKLLLYIALFAAGFLIIKKLSELEDKHEEAAATLGVAGASSDGKTLDSDGFTQDESIHDETVEVDTKNKE